MSFETDAPMCIHWRNGMPFVQSKTLHVGVCPTCRPEAVA